MSTNSHLKKKVTAFISIIFLLPPLIQFILWVSIGIRFPDLTEVDRQTTFLGYFSGIFQNIHIVNIVSVIFCLVAIILASRSFQKRLLSLRILMLVTVVIAVFIILFDISQLVRVAY